MRPMRPSVLLQYLVPQRLMSGAVRWATHARWRPWKDFLIDTIARTYGVYFMGEHDPFLERMRARFKLEHGLLVGGTLILAGLIGGIVIVVDWLASGAGSLGQGEIALLAATGLVAGFQIFFTSFVLSILGLRRPT